MTSAKIADKTIQNVDLADGIVTSAKIADGTIANVDIANGTIAPAKLTTAAQYLLNGGGILWSGALFMQSGQSATLSRKVSEQRSGLVFVWSAYEGSTQYNSYWSAFFVPKQIVAAASGTGWEFDLDPSDRKGMAKYLYISDTKVTGNKVNNTRGTTPGGRVFDNLLYVLRYIIGV